ncbi:MAG: DUF1934 domain-containing protein [Clostridia bacterium]|nr:DUF1934 domain-containing protein [Clostridia bacterium]
MSTVSARGRFTKSDDGMRFDYVLDGDECTLTVKESEAVQTRRGEQNVKMIFRKGEQTECFLGSGGFSGAFGVFTHELQFADCVLNIGKKSVKVYTLLIVYTLGEDKIELTFSAKI